VSTELVRETVRERTRRPLREAAVSLVGPVTVAVGLLWALLQPYRITLLSPRGEGFWWLAVQPPLLVIGVGVLFHLVVVPGVLEDLRRQRDEKGGE
jgi:hypothetical protein